MTDSETNRIIKFIAKHRHYYTYKDNKAFDAYKKCFNQNPTTAVKFAWAVEMFLHQREFFDKKLAMANEEITTHNFER